MKSKAASSSFLLVVFLFSCFTRSASAGSATWNLNPTSGDWNTAANWTPAVVPNGSADVATFGVSNLTAVSTSADTTVGSIVFNPGASAYTITTSTGLGLHFDAGITNNSGVAQTFVNTGGAYDFSFAGFSTSTAGTETFFTGGVVFRSFATAGSGTFTAPGGTVSGGFAEQILFFDRTNAADGTFYINGSEFADPNTAGVIAFEKISSAGNATITLGAGVNGGSGGHMILFDGATGGTARVIFEGNGYLDASPDTRLVLTLGSIEGAGRVTLGAVNLSLGTNNLSTTFTGLIEDGLFGSGGAITKTGSGTLTLSGANTYTGATTVSAGAMKVANKTGSATGTGAVKVDAGTMGGPGTISGSVTIGTGNGAGAFLESSVGASKPTKLTIQSMLTCKADATYTYKLNTKKAKADQVVANGVTIESGAQFNLAAIGNKKLNAGTSFTALNNTAATPINGTFANLVDGSTVTVGNNSYQVSYSGKDGNDLTLTVVP